MKNKEFIQKYEELLDRGYCDCNELNCLDNNPPRKILSIMREQQEEIERLNNIIKELEKESYLGMIENQNNNDYSKGLYTAYKYINDKLQELKGSDKE